MDQGQLDALYQQYLGRGVDPSGASTWGNADYQTVVNGILGSQEYQNRQSASQPQAQPQATNQEPPPDWLRPEDYQANGYAAPYTAQQISQPVDPSWYRPASGGVTYASLKGPSDLSGGEYVIDTRTGSFAKDANGNPIPVPRPNDPNSFNSSFADQWIPAGIALMAAGTGLGAAGLIGEGAAAAGAGGELMGPTYGELGYTGLGEGMMGPTYAEMGYTGLNGAEAVAAADAAAASQLASAGMTASQIANYAKAGISLAGLASKLLGGSGSTGTSTGTNPYASLLKSGSSTGTVGTSGSTTINPTALPNLLRGNTNPYNFGQQTPTMMATQKSNADPFAALKVEQLDPTKQYNPLAMLKNEGIYG